MPNPDPYPNFMHSTPSAGDASGPASSTDNAIARYDGTGGKTLQNSGVTIDDSDNVTGVANLTTTGQILAADGSLGAPGIAFSGNTQMGIFRSTNELHICPAGGTVALKLATTALYPTSGLDLGVAAAPFDNAFLGGYLSCADMSAPTGVANKAIIFAQDNGAGKTQLMVVFGDNTPQQIKIEP